MFIVSRTEPLSSPYTAGKLVKARDFWAFQEAERMLADAAAQRDRILQEARQAYRDEMARGYADGRDEALREQSSAMVETVTRTVDYFRKVEGEMVELVLEAVRKVVSDFDDRQRLAAVVRSCLDLVRSQKQLSMSVHPDQVTYLRGQVDRLKQIYPSIAELEIHPDPRLAPDACLVESDIGVVEASLSGQIEILKQVLGSVFEPEVLDPDGDLVCPDAQPDTADPALDGPVAP